MSKEVDERVVSMQFDNKNFESNVQTSLGTLDRLKKSLNMDGASKGLEQVESASKRVNFSGLGNAVESVHAKFSALEVMGVTALANITNSAVNAGKKIVSALTIDPITTGFQEYETQINAVQTILANTESKGTTLQQVNSALDTLNTYADKTIYNFTEMTRNIGTFTAAGVDLDKSVSAIQGIANLAAVSGSSSQQASTAMYQLSQALSSGTVKLQDWNSVVNAGMGGQVFQDALKQTARIHGVAIDQMIEEQGSFRETLQEGWLTSDILTETLNQFTMAAEEGSDAWNSYKKSLMDQGYTEEQALSILKMANTATDAATKVKTFTQLWDTLKESAQSGWTQSWEIIVGDFEEAKGFLTDVSNRVGDLIGAASDARNEMLSGGLSSGWKQLLNEGIADEEGYKETLKSVAKEHGVSIDNMIKAEKKLDDSLTDTEAFQKALQKGFKEGSLSSDMLTKSVHKMAAKMSKMSDEELKAAGYTADNVIQIQKLSKGLKDGSVSMDDFAKKISRTSGRENIIQALWNAFNGLMSVIEPVQEALREIFPPITGEQLYSFTETLAKLSEKLTISGETADKIKRAFKGVFAIFDIGVQAVKALFNAFAGLIKYISPAGGTFLEFSANLGDAIVKFDEFIKSSDVFNKAIQKIADFLQPIINKFKEFVSKIANAISEIGSIDTSGIDSFAGKIKKRFEPLEALGKAISGIFGFMADVLKKVAPIFVAVGAKIGEAFQGMREKISDSINNLDYNGIFDFINSGLFVTIGAFIAKFIKSLTGITDNAAGFIESIQGILDGVSDSLNAFTESIKAKTLKTIATAIAILAASLLVLSFIPSEKLTASLGVITALFAELFASMSIFEKLMGKDGFKGLQKVSSTMIALSVAVLILSSAMTKLAKLDWEGIGKGLVGIAGLSAILVASAKILSKNQKGLVKGAAGLILFAAAVKILASAAQDLAKMEWGDLAKAGAAMAGVLVIFAGFAALVKLIKPEKMISSGVALIIIAASMKIFASAAKDFAEMEWEGIAKAVVAMGAILALSAGFSLLASLSKKMLKSAVSLVVIAASMKIFASATKDFADLEWEGIAKASVAMGAILALSAGFALLSGLAKKMLVSATSLVVIAAAMEIFADVCQKFGAMEWEDLGKAGAAIAGILALSAGFALLGKLAPNMIVSAGALLIMSAALSIMTVVLKTLGGMSWDEIVRGLTALAGVFAVLGVAGLVLKPLVPTILALAGAVALLGVGCAAVGAGVALLSAGLLALSAAGSGAAVAITVIVSSLIGLIPYLIQQIGVGIISLCEVIAGSLDAICKAIATIIVAACLAIKEAVPVLVETVLVVVVEVLNSLVKHTPDIIAGIFDFLIAVLDGIAAKLPDLIASVVNVIMSFFSGVLQALGNVDPTVLIEGIAAVGIVSAVLVAMAAMAALAPAAMVGVVAAGVVIAELAAMIAAVGALAQISGLEWLISEGGNLMQAIGTAIGQFIGGIAGGIAQGLSSSLPQIGTDLSSFMTNAMPFIEGAKKIDASAMNGVQSLVGVILALTAANVLEGLTSWFTGGSSLTKFGEEIAAFGPYLASYADSISGVDGSVVTASASAAEALSTLANGLPKSGGLSQLLGGEQNIGAFGEQLVPFGEGLSAFSEAAEGIDPETIKAAAEAGKYLADLANCIPNEGGVVSWLAGDNSIAKFGGELVSLGEGLAGFSEKVSGLDPEVIATAAQAAKSLAEMASCIPDEGGVVSWFAGDNSVAKFSSELVSLGEGLKGFSLAITGINNEAITAAASAAKDLALMANCVPNEGGVVSWFAGENSIAKFGSDLVSLGEGLKGFSLAIVGIDTEAVTAAAYAAKSLAEMTSYIPNEGGIASWFTGESSISKFGSDLVSLGEGLKGFATQVAGIDTEAVTAASSAAKSLAEMTSYIPNEGGIGSWFAGEKSVSKFSTELENLGKGLKGFATQVTGIDTEAVTAASNAAKTLAEMTSYIPNEGGIGSWFAGEKSVSKFSTELENLGKGLKGFATQVTGIDTEAVTAAANAAKTIAEMTNIIPNEGGIGSWFCGEKSLSKFSGELAELGKGINGFSNEITDVDPDKVSSAANAAKTIAELTNTAPENMDRLTTFGSALISFGENLSSYFSNIGGVNKDAIGLSKEAVEAVKNFGTAFNPEKITAAVEAANKMVDMAKGMADVTAKSTAGFTKSMAELGKTNVDSFIKAFKDAEKDMSDAGKNLMTKFTSAIKDKKSDAEKLGQDILKKFVLGIKDGDQVSKAKTACEDMVDKCAKAIKTKQSAFSGAGKYLVEGFSDGIDENTFKAKASAKAMAKAAYEAAKDELDINSPSKVFRKMGGSVPEGFAQGIDRLSGLASKSSEEMARDSIKSTSNAISHIADAINSDIDVQPTIRPVIDLTNVKSGANAIGGMLSGRRTISLNTDSVGVVSASMASYQNGRNSDEIVSAIKALRSDIANTPRNSYNINGISYDDGSNISTAVRDLVRAAKIERRI